MSIYESIYSNCYAAPLMYTFIGSMLHGGEKIIYTNFQDEDTKCTGVECYM